MRRFGLLGWVLVLSSSPVWAVDLSQAMHACPGAAAFIEAQVAQQRAALSVGPSVVSDNVRRERLLALQDEDQRLYERLASGSIDVTALMPVKERHLSYLRQELGDSVAIPSVGEVGRDGLAALWLLVQHADDDPSLQAKALANFEPLVKRGELDASKFALLSDRVLLASGKPQRFGTQLRSLETGEPLKLDSPASVERERTALGLMSTEDYRCISDQLYRSAR